MATFVRTVTAALLLAGMTLFSLPVPQLRAQDATVEISSRAASIRVGGRLHSQFAASSAEGEKSTDFFMRRARLILEISVTEYLDGRVQHDFVAGLQDAYFRVGFSPAFRISMGQFHRAFDIFELTSSTKMMVVERDGRVPGSTHCSELGGICSFSRFTEKLSYAGRDVGLRFDGALASGRIKYLATFTNGPGIGRRDENRALSFSGRLTTKVRDGVVLGANAGFHDYPRDTGESAYGAVFGVDLEVGTFMDGFHLQAGIAGGDHWKALDEDGVPGSFVAGQGIVSYYRTVTSLGPFIAIEPVGRVSWGDPNLDEADDQGILVTPGLFLFVAGRNRIGTNLDMYTPTGGPTVWSFKVQSYLYF